MSLGPFVRPNSREESDDLNEMDRLPLIHIVADLIREKDKVQRSYARVLPYDKALRLERSSTIKRNSFPSHVSSCCKDQWSKGC